MSVSSSGTTVDSTGSTAVPSIVDYGVGSGLNTDSIIQAELATYVAPETRLQTQQTQIASNVTAYQQINADLLALQTQAGSLATSNGWNAQQATSTNSAVATATAADGTPAGSVQFSVTQLASASSLISAGTASSTSQIVTSAPSVVVAQGASQLGLASLSAGTGLSVGNHTVAVTQASQAASATGTIALGKQANIGVPDGSNSIDVTVNEKAYTLTLPSAPLIIGPPTSGGYTPDALLAAVEASIPSGSGIVAGYDTSGHLVLSTADQGSSQSLQITGGTALSTLGLSATATPSTGVDGIVSVDGTSNTLSDVQAGQTDVPLNGPSGSTLQVTLAGSSSQAQVNSSLLSVGSVTAANVSTGNGSLGDIVSNINSAGTGVTASAIQTGTNAYALQLSSSVTGTGSAVSVSPDAFSGSSLGALDVASAGSNAQIQIGGTGGYTLQSQTNTFAGLLPGLSVAVQAVSTAPVTVTVSPDASSVAKQVQTLVNDANTALTDVQTEAGYNATTKVAGPLIGSAVLQTVTNQIQSIFASTVGSSSVGTARNVGITLSDGQLSFDQSTFEAAFTANPTAVSSLFTQGGSFAASQPSDAGQVSLAYATNSTKSGSYDVNVSKSATQAVANGSVATGGTVSAGEQLTITSGSSAVPYTTTAGQSLTSIASGLNQAFASASNGLSAQVVNNGTQLQIASDSYGSAAAFTVTTSNTAAGTTGLAGSSGTVSATGTDVAGTINGAAATGSGQYLTAGYTDPSTAGLSLLVSATGITSSTDLGQFKYAPGIAQSLATLGTAMSDPVTGALTQTVKGLQSQSLGLNPQIQLYASIVSQEQTLLTNQYAKLDATLSSLTNQGTALTSELAQLAANSAASA